MSLTDIFSEGDFQFQMRLERGGIAEFFAPSAQRERILSERRSWLAANPMVYAALLPPGVPQLEECVKLARALGPPAPAGPAFSATDPIDRLRELGVWWEPDFLLLQPDHKGQIRLWGGCVCFPSSWSLSEKVGHPIEFIHDAVPGLNRDIGPQIHSFLARLKPGFAWQRTNWGLSRSSELNQHPRRNLPRLDDTVGPSEIWLRVEHQALVALPESGGILFGIRIALHELSKVMSDPTASERLVRALSTMPDAVAEYKGLTTARRQILSILDRGHTL